MAGTARQAIITGDLKWTPLLDITIMTSWHDSVQILHNEEQKYVCLNVC